jgi:hypothetical protein
MTHTAVTRRRHGTRPMPSTISPMRPKPRAISNSTCEGVRQRGTGYTKGGTTAAWYSTFCPEIPGILLFAFCSLANWLAHCLHLLVKASATLLHFLVGQQHRGWSTFCPGIPGILLFCRCFPLECLFSSKVVVVLVVVVVVVVVRQRPQEAFFPRPRTQVRPCKVAPACRMGRTVRPNSGVPNGGNSKHCRIERFLEGVGKYSMKAFQLQAGQN